MKTITLPPGTLHLDIDDIADYMALCMWPLRDDDSPGDGLHYGYCYATLKAELAQAVESRELPARDPLTRGLHAHPYGENVKHALVRVDDLRKYVAPRGLLVDVLETEAPAQNTATPAAAVAASDGPEPLTRNEIANCFAGLRGWDLERWKAELSSPDDWLKACRQRKGTRGSGGYESTWWPVCIAVAMVDRNDTTAKMACARFKSQEPLKPWLDALRINYPDEV